MSRDERHYRLREDVADASREDNLRDVKGKAAYSKPPRGCNANTAPTASFKRLSQSGMWAGHRHPPRHEARRGKFSSSYIWPAMMQIRDELCVMRWRSDESSKSPVVLRVAIGGYLTGGAVFHSQSGDSIFTPALACA